MQRGCGQNFQSEKLAPNLQPKKAYVVHLRNLQFYLSKGVRLVGVRRAISFRQEAWIEPYISGNTALRQQAVDDFEKDYFKLLNNAFFGKTMENVRNRIRIELVNSERRHWWYTSKPSFKRFEIFDEDLVGAELAVTNVCLDRPMYVGFTVLELSKLLMYKFHYEVVKVNFPESVLCFTDTDSFLYQITCKNLYSEHLYRMREYFDFSNYPENHILFPPEISEEERQIVRNSNKAVVGKFKDEAAGLPLREFVGLRSKMYSILLDNGKQKNTAAGVKKCVRDRELTHSLYRRVLLGSSTIIPEDQPLEDHWIRQVTFRSHNHTVFTVGQLKVGLTRYDDKRWILQDGVSTRPHGHYLNQND